MATTDNNLTKRYYKSDFDLLVSFALLEGSVLSPFRLAFRSAGQKAYVATYDGETYTNCQRMDDTHVLVHFNNAGLGIGELFLTATFYLDNASYADGSQAVVRFAKTDIALTGDPDDCPCTPQPFVQLYPDYQRGEQGPQGPKGDKGDKGESGGVTADQLATLATKQYVDDAIAQSVVQKLNSEY